MALTNNGNIRTSSQTIIGSANSQGELAVNSKPGTGSVLTLVDSSTGNSVYLWCHNGTLRHHTAFPVTWASDGSAV